MSVWNFVSCSTPPFHSVVCNIELFSKRNNVFVFTDGRNKEKSEGGGQAGFLFLPSPPYTWSKCTVPTLNPNADELFLGFPFGFYNILVSLMVSLN